MRISKPFQALDRLLDLDRHYILEASAGTGKTYSIENIVVRLLIGAEPLQLKEILVVTFTRAATRDLKMRIRNNIVKAIDYLQGESSKGVPDYLQALMEKGEGQVTQAKKMLEEALFCFDEAQIFTIHAFCSRMLCDHVFEGDISLDSIGMAEQLPASTQLKIVNDFLRSGLVPEKYSKGQIKNLLSMYKNDVEKVKLGILKVVNQGLEINPGPTFAGTLNCFMECMTYMKHTFNITKTRLLDDFEQLKKHYKKVEGEESKAHRFAAFFEKDAWEANDLDILLQDGLIWLEKTREGNQRVKKPSEPIKLHYPELITYLEKDLKPLIYSASDPMALLARIASDCQAHMRNFLEQEELMGCDDILKAMRKGIDLPQFADRVRTCYKAAIIDEFQDTDPIQWDIFRKLFLEVEQKWGRLYLVGDPKQSIYSFRQADIYTYLAAAKALGPDAHRSLDTNYRSQPKLVEALNALFDPAFSPGLIDLPRQRSYLDYEFVKAGMTALPKSFDDDRGAVHFVTFEGNDKKLTKEALEKNHLFPFIVHEILHLMEQGCNPKQLAILVKDRYQAERLMEALKQWNIPAANQRNSPLADSPAITVYRELLKAAINPRSESSLKTALGGPILSWTHERIILLKDHALIEKILLKFYLLRRTLNEQGIASFYQELMRTSFMDGSRSVSEELLSREGGEELYQDLLQLTELLAEEQSRFNTTPEGLIAYLDDLKNEGDEENGVMRRSNPDDDAVQILTIHKSKGLEFDVVFTLGLIGTSKEPQTLIPKLGREGYFSLYTTTEEDSDYLDYCREVDAEKIRQLYVALTRAKLRVYVPAVFEIEKKLNPGTASPMQLFAARLGQPLASYGEVYDRIKTHSASSFEGILNKLGISYTRLNEFPLSLHSYKNKIPIELNEPKRVEVSGQPQYMYSYTTLSKGIAKEDPVFVQSPPHNFYNEEKNPHTIPSGSQIGTLLHKVLEKVDFKKIKMIQSFKDLYPFISPYLQSTPYEEWMEAIALVIFNALHTPLPLHGGKKALVDLNPSAMYRETEFIYPWEKALELPELEYSPGFLKGVIDLIFEHHGKYYLLDWKSNWLGPSCQEYKQDELKKAMQDNHYFLQAAVYNEALSRYIRLFDSRPFSEIFGGTFYVFLRGLDALSGNENGIYLLR